MSSRPVYWMMCAELAPSGECLQGKSPPDRMLAKTLAQSVSGCLYPLGIVVAAVLRDSLCVHCCPAWQTVVCCIPRVRLSGLS